MTNIYFCDVCNESVPQADLDLGRALVVKGRIICSACDRAMSLRAEARAHRRPANLGLDLDAGVPLGAAAASTDGAAAASPSTAGTATIGAGAHAPEPHLAAHSHAARSRLVTGVGPAFTLALFAAIGAVLVAYWTREELQTRDQARALAEQRAAAERSNARVELDRIGEELRERARQSEVMLAGALEAARTSSEQARAAERAEREQMAQRLAVFDAKLGELATALEQVGRHEDELVALQQRFTTLDAGLNALSDQIAKWGQAPPALPTAAPPAPPVDQRPAWFELTHLLESPNISDRWQGLIALGETRDPACAPYITPLLSDKDIFIRMTSARMLGDLEAPVGVEPLIGALSDAEPAVREAAIDALRRITKRDLDFDPQASEPERNKRAKQWRDWWSKEREKLGV